LVRLRIERDGDRLKVTVEDDGRGLDLAAIAAAARSRGLETAAAPDAEGLARLILRPGFSTAARLSSLSGRGMGLAVVAEAVSRLNGELRFGAGEAGGFAIILLAPVSMTADRVVLVSAAGHTFALPNHGLERLLRLRPDEIEAGDAGEFVRLDGKPVLLLRLADLLDLPARPPGPGPDSEPAGAACPAAVLRAGEQRLAVAVDALLEEREVLVRDLGLPPAMSGVTAGAVPLEDGAVAVVLSAAALITRGHQLGGERAPLRSAAVPAPRPACILVVDDSITTRSLERSILEAHGYQVRLAVDGAEALDQLERDPADLVIADVAMPRMDGFELLERMKAHERLAGIPVIMVTSMEKREDQERGLRLGADAYIIKRKFDQRELLATVRQIL
jgi:two-component system chemotaxis sensor kinase CheA